MSSMANCRSARFVYKGKTMAIVFQHDQPPSEVIKKVRLSFSIKEDKLVYLLDSKQAVHDELPVNEEIYVVKTEPEELGGFGQFWETLRCCALQPVGWEKNEDYM
mmetsp:Transcript_23385/g.47268  ORF Transcript_23385/g.47268 Transcript_23385/m.47268 type:complete len:105 (+) Transcript_23385:73-387(+)|eukprot:CAMPEP_0181300244 /NCGR_PEP_ID=MMETSP1101-20121128/6786_1 /TAXON_ID=46948 /ORGANISM="Rhodomonas abbreviata, Strain Caron Lab Isolate" /LENGTH=104 /DNA_ID=CAMNT_0023405467 /DNA_START=73 /DNA_END=387 /DNA_ORIENTATION=+